MRGFAQRQLHGSVPGTELRAVKPTIACRRLVSTQPPMLSSPTAFDLFPRGLRTSNSWFFISSFLSSFCHRFQVQA